MEIAKQHAETETAFGSSQFEKFRIVQNRSFESDYDRFFEVRKRSEVGKGINV